VVAGLSQSPGARQPTQLPLPSHSAPPSLQAVRAAAAAVAQQRKLQSVVKHAVGGNGQSAQRCRPACRRSWLAGRWERRARRTTRDKPRTKMSRGVFTSCV